MNAIDPAHRFHYCYPVLRNRNFSTIHPSAVEVALSQIASDWGDLKDIPIRDALKEWWMAKIRSKGGLQSLIEEFKKPLFPPSEFFEIRKLRVAYRKYLGGIEQKISLEKDERQLVCLFGQAYRVKELFYKAYRELPPIDFTHPSTYYILRKNIREPRDNLVLPTVHGLALLTSHYEVKYGVPIVLATFAKLCRLAIADLPRPYGVILVAPEKDRNTHVTPLIIMPRLGKRNQIVQLDSVGGAANLSGVASDCFINLAMKRQADDWSCRIDAVAILSNALWDIHRKGLTDLIDYTDNGKKLPAAWAKTVQRSEALKGVNTQEPVRTKDEDKSLAAFLKRHEEGGLWRYLFKKGYQYAAKIDQLLETRQARVWENFQAKLMDLEWQGFSVRDLPLSN